jgi:hypothetical protein
MKRKYQELKIENGCILIRKDKLVMRVEECGAKNKK